MNEEYTLYDVLDECVDGIIYDYTKEYSNRVCGGRNRGYLMGMVDMYKMLKADDYVTGMTEINALEFLINQAYFEYESNIDIGCDESEEREYLEMKLDIYTKAINEINDLLDECAEELLND